MFLDTFSNCVLEYTAFVKLQAENRNLCVEILSNLEVNYNCERIWCQQMWMRDLYQPTPK